MFQKVVVEVKTKKSIESAWMVFTNPAYVVKWNFASADWCCPRATNDLRVGGIFSYRMESVDGKVGFDFEGTFTRIAPHEELSYSLGDSRTVTVAFIPQKDGVLIQETFDAEGENTVELQKNGWQAILNNYLRVLEAL